MVEINISPQIDKFELFLDTNYNLFFWPAFDVTGLVIGGIPTTRLSTFG
jgi:hypothetical protein